MENIWINDCSSGGIFVYRLMRGHDALDELVSTKRLTWSEQDDIAQGYREALNNTLEDE